MDRNDITYEGATTMLVYVIHTATLRTVLDSAINPACPDLLERQMA